MERRIFGTRENAQYFDREGAYFIPCHGDLIGVVETPKGYFLLGGGLENEESHLECIQRECMEEAGYRVCVEGRLCSAESYMKHPTIGYFHPIQTYYIGQLLEKVAEPIEKDHVFCWVEYAQLKGKMALQMQNWALDVLKK